MKRCPHTVTCWMFTALLTLYMWGCNRSTAERPNILFFLIDDLGWTDTGVYGSTFYETPNIDRLAAAGARFTQFYSASPVCSPTRASIMTGKDPARLHITNWIGGDQAGMLLQAEYSRELSLEEITLGDAFKDAGYATGYIGKWHLGAEGYLPPSQGFDFSFAVNHAGQPGSYFYPYENANWPVTNVPDLEDGGPGDYLTDQLTDAALEFIVTHHDTPFFLIFSHYAVHTPLQSKVELTAKYDSKAQNLPAAGSPAFLQEGASVTKVRHDHAVYAGMIESADHSVGRVLAVLDSLEIADHTVIVFVSDNGGLSTLPRSRSIPTSNLPLRAGKGWLYEGGVRVPLIVKWPGAVAGGGVIDAPAITMDIYPTLLEIAGLPPRPDQHRDGLSLVPALLGTGELDRRPLFFHFPHYHGSGNRPSGAVRIGDYKLIEWFEDGRIELYDLSTDIGESQDLAVERPEVAGELHDTLLKWRRSIGARMPTPNPDWQPN